MGTVLADRYRIDALIGEGGMGRVYSAEHVLMRKRLAIKVLHRELTTMPEVVARFEREVQGVRGRDGGKHIVATVPGVSDRDAAEALRGTEILVPREALPPPAPGEYYWVDLEGLRVVTVEGVALGEVSHLLSTGANDVMVVRGERERMLPFVQPDYVKSVDFESGTITVDWDPEF